MWTRTWRGRTTSCLKQGTHTDAIKMSYRDYEKMVKPKVEDLAIKLHPMKGA